MQRVIKSKRKNHKQDGLSKGYYESGLKYELNYKKDIPEGLGKIYFESVLHIKRENFKNGILVGEWTRK